MILGKTMHLLERDYFLGLESPLWPPNDMKLLQVQSRQLTESATQGTGRSGHWFAESWERVIEGDSFGYLWRRLSRKDAPREPSDSLYETVVRFPSAPLFGSQRKRDYQFRLRPIHQHTFRLLTADPPGTTRIGRLFLLFNGLNEIDNFDFYYNLAAMLINRSKLKSSIACLIYPLPGHLTRYPMLGRYAERPLHRFITDPSDLFRQYLRFMVEIQWLLSVLVPVSYYPVTSGMPLLAEEENVPHGGRCNIDCLSGTIANAWEEIYRNSLQLLKRRTSYNDLRKSALPVTKDHVRQSIAAVRSLIQWQPFEKNLIECRQDDPLPSPGIHVIGYSLGGYLAQSTFFSWPFAIGSCTTLCAGAALHELRPMKIAHEEEWRSITHGLKYEIECGMLEGRIKIQTSKMPRSRSVCGISASDFSSHYRIFTDVFLQDPHGSYRSRVSEFVPRLLFVVGGNDPIVSTRSVLDASPPEGINMIEIANLSHFIAIERGEWSDFWLPAVADILSSLSDRSEVLQSISVLSNLWNPETTGPVAQEWPSKKYDSSELVEHAKERRDSESLGSELMRRNLFEFVQPLNNGAYLFILRNQIPFTFMGSRLLHRRGSVPHYEDFQIRRFWQDLQDRWTTMRKDVDRITLVIPGRLNEWFVQQPSILSSKCLPLAREVGDERSLSELWAHFLAVWEGTGAVHRFDPEHPGEISAESFPLECIVREDASTPAEHPVINCLPDVWISLSQEAIKDIAGENARRVAVHKGFLNRILEIYRQHHGREKDRKDAVEKTRDWLSSGSMKILRISAAQPNSHFLGERIWDFRTAIDILVHSGLALARSTLCLERGDFEKNWPR